jgi:hypothetical protein
MTRGPPTSKFMEEKYLNLQTCDSSGGIVPRKHNSSLNSFAIKIIALKKIMYQVCRREHIWR